MFYYVWIAFKNKIKTGHKVGMEMWTDLQGAGEGSKHDQNTLYGILKELIQN